MGNPDMKMRMTRLMFAAMLCMMAASAWGTTAYVSTCEELLAAIGNVSVDNIIVTANVDVPCETSGNAGSTDMTGAATAQLIINRSLTLQSQAGSKYIIKRVAASGATSYALKSLIAVRGNGKGESGTANLTENTVEVSFTNIIIDGGANWGSASVDDRRKAVADAYGCSGRATIDVYLGATLNLEDGVEVRNGFTTKSDNSLLNDSGTSVCFGGAVRVDYHNNTGGGTINVKAGAIIHDCTARGGYGGALGAYNYARLNLYGGTIYNCSATHGGAITCTYRSSTDYSDTTAGTIRMYGGTISNCYAENGGALCTHGPVEDYVLGGAITSCQATYGGAIYQAFNSTVVHIVAYASKKLTISDCVNTHETDTSDTGGYKYVYLSSGSINETPVYQVTFRDNNANFAVLSVVQGASLGEAFPAAPVNANFRFVGWYKDNTPFTSSTAINENTIVTAKWDFMGSGTENDPYLVSSAEVWDFLADQVNAGNNYSGKYFLQTADISVSSHLIGYPIDDNSYVSFSGIYDGGGHTITASISAIDQRYVAPFRCIADAIIKNVVVTGDVTVSGGKNVGIDRRRHPAGLVGVTEGTCVIQNCRVSADISGTDYMGGILGHSMKANITMTGCVYDGALTVDDTNYTGGLIGWGGDGGGMTLTIKDSFFAGSYSGNGKFHPIGICTTDGNNRAATNTYYTAAYSNITDDDDHSFVHALSVGNKGKAVSSLSDNPSGVAALGVPGTGYDVSGLVVGPHGVKYNGICYVDAVMTDTFQKVFGQPEGEVIAGIEVAGGSVTVETVAVVGGNDFTVKYELDRVAASGEVLSAGTASNSADALGIDFESVKSNAYFKVAVVLESTDGTAAQTKVLSDTKIGVLAITNAPATTIIGVPWVALSGGEVSVSNLVYTANLTAGDTIKVYDATDKVYKMWELDEDAGGNKEWVPSTTTTTGGSSIADEASEATIPRGVGVWLTRQHPGTPIYLVGMPTDEDVTTPLDAPEASGSQTWNLVASPKVEPVDVAELLEGKKATDQVMVPTAGAPKNFLYRNGNWGYIDYESDDYGLVYPVFKTDTTIPAGTGFWYLNGDPGYNQLEWN